MISGAQLAVRPRFRGSTLWQYGRLHTVPSYDMAHDNPFLLAAESPPNPALLPLLRSNPELASRQDNHGYSLLHAASSYNHTDLLRSLVKEFHVDVDLRDEDGETCLFVTETVPVAKCLIEELHVDLGITNHEGQTAAEKISQEVDFPDLAAYLQSVSAGPASGVAVSGDATSHPSPLPPNVTIDVGTVVQGSTGGDDQEPDPEFRRRIEELAARADFQSQQGQQELRELIADAVRGVGDGRGVRRRVE